MQYIVSGSQACFLVFVVGIAIFDAWERRVPNILLLVGIFFAFVALAMGRSIGGIGFLGGLLGLLVGFLTFLPLYLFGLMAAGDVKFFAVLGLWLGAYALFPIWLVASIIAGVQAGIWYIVSNGSFARVRGSDSLLMRKLKEIPYASYLTIGAVLVVYFPGLVANFMLG